MPMAAPQNTATSTNTTLPPTAMPLISPPALLQAYLSQSPPTRPSNRAPTQLRPINLNTSSLTHCNGSSLVKVGETTIVCGIRAELLPVSEIPHYRASENARITADQLDEEEDANYEAITLNNLLVPNLELGTNAHPSFPANVAPSVTAQSISQRVLSLLHSSRLVRVKDLEVRHSSDPAVSTDLDPDDPAVSTDLNPDDPAYIEPEKNVLKAYWTLYIDCVCLSYGGEGNVFDTTVMAVVAALRDVRLPESRWDEDRKVVVSNADFQRASRLDLRGLLCPLSFGVFVGDERLGSARGAQQVNGADGKFHSATVLLDTDLFEDGVCEEKGNVVVDCSDGACNIVRLEKAGGSGRLAVTGVKEVVRNAEKRWKQWRDVIEKATGPGG